MSNWSLEASSCCFCLEDRALFCQECNVAIHAANPYVSVHQRFLLSCKQVNLDSIGPVGLISTQQLNTAGRAEEPPSASLPKEKPPLPSTEPNVNEPLWSQGGRDPKMPPEGRSGMPESTPDWPLNDLFVFPDFNREFDVIEHNSFKVLVDEMDILETECIWRRKLDGLEFYCSSDQKLNPKICSSQVPDFSWTVPESPSPAPTASRLHWQRDHPFSRSENAAFVPDIPSNDFDFWKG